MLYVGGGEKSADEKCIRKSTYKLLLMQLRKNEF